MAFFLGFRGQLTYPDFELGTVSPEPHHGVRAPPWEPTERHGDAERVQDAEGEREEAVQARGEPSPGGLTSSLDRTRRFGSCVRSQGGPACPKKRGQVLTVNYSE